MFSLEGIDWRFLGAFAFIFGLMIGSFLNVVIFRLPEERSIVWPGSHCPKCQHVLSAWENLPVLSWILLGAKCRSCKLPISWRYPAIELATGLLFLAVFAKFGPTLQTLMLFVLLGLMIVTFWIDVDRMEIYDIVTLPGVVIGLLYSWLVTQQFLYALSAVLAAVAILLFINGVTMLAIGRDGIGGGDFTLVAMLGAWLGLEQTLVALGLAMLAGAGLGLAVLFYRWALAREWKPFALAAVVGGVTYLAFASLFAMPVGAGGPPAIDMATRAMVVLLAALMGSASGWLYMRSVRDDGYLEMPFGPALVLGALGALFWGAPLVTWYLERMGAPSLPI